MPDQRQLHDNVHGKRGILAGFDEKGSAAAPPTPARSGKPAASTRKFHTGNTRPAAGAINDFRALARFPLAILTRSSAEPVTAPRQRAAGALVPGSGVARQGDQHTLDEEVQFLHVIGEELGSGVIGDGAILGNQPRGEMDVRLQCVHQR